MCVCVRVHVAADVIRDWVVSDPRPVLVHVISGTLTPSPCGLQDDHAARYAQFGDWIRACYGSPVVGTSGHGTEFNLTVPASQSVDRLVIREAIDRGQRILSYRTDLLPAGSAVWQPLTNGTSVGNRRIEILRARIAGGTVRLRITQAAASFAILDLFAVYAPCPNA